VKGVDHAIWRRILKVPFDVQIPRERWDLKLREKLLAEREGIFRWMVEGAMEWYLHGLDVPQEVRESTEEYRESSDILGDFVDMCLVRDRNSELPVKELYEIYAAWCLVRDEYRLSKRRFVQNLTDRGFKSRKGTANTSFKTGLALNPVLKETLESENVWTLPEEERKIVLKEVVTQVTHLSCFRNFSIREEYVEKSYGNRERRVTSVTNDGDSYRFLEDGMGYSSYQKNFRNAKNSQNDENEGSSIGNDGMIENKNPSDEYKNLSVSGEDRDSTKLNSLNDNCRRDYEIRKSQAEIMKEVFVEISSYTPANYDIAKNMEINRLQKDYGISEDRACEIVDRVVEDLQRRG